MAVALNVLAAMSTVMVFEAWADSMVSVEPRAVFAPSVSVRFASADEIADIVVGQVMLPSVTVMFALYIWNCTLPVPVAAIVPRFE